MFKTIFAALLLLFTGSSLPPTYQKYCNEHKFKAQLLEYQTGVPTSVQLAQAIIESGAGRSKLAKVSNNHFGIKKGDNWSGETFSFKGSSVKWRKYPNIGLSYIDHACFLSDNYGGACGKPWSYWVKYCKGYGGPDYWQRVGEIITLYNLNKFDLHIKK